jgi:hypothetical protein
VYLTLTIAAYPQEISWRLTSWNTAAMAHTGLRSWERRGYVAVEGMPLDSSRAVLGAALRAVLAKLGEAEDLTS